MVRNIFKNTIALFIANAGYMIGSIVLVSFLSRTLQAEGLGSFSIAMALFGLAQLACDFGLSNFLPRELGKNPALTNRYLIHTILLVLVTALVSAILLAALAQHLGYSSETVASLYMIAPALVPLALRGVIGAIFIAHQRVEFETFTTILWTILRVLVSLYVLSQGYGVVGVIIIFTLTNYLALFNSVFFYVRFIEKPYWEFDWAFFKGMLRNLKYFVILALAGSVFVNAETVILSLLKDEAQVGVYSAAFKLITVWYLIPQSFMGVIFPVMSQAYQESSYKSQVIRDKSIKYLLFLALPLSVGGFVTADSIINLFYGSGFEASIIVFRVMAWHMVLAFINNVFWRVLLANDQQHLAVRVQVISGVIRVGLSFLLIPAWDALGASCALMGGYIIYTLLHIYYVQRGSAPIEFFRLGWRFAVAALGMGVLVWILSPYLHLIVLVSIGGAIYLLLVFLLQAFSTDDFVLLQKIWRPKTTEQRL